MIDAWDPTLNIFLEETMNNLDIRDEIHTSGLRFWQVADALGLNDGNFSRKLRHELSDADKAKIRTVIRKLASERED